MSVSVLRFIAQIEDNNSEFECKAENALLERSVGSVRDSVHLAIRCKLHCVGQTFKNALVSMGN